MRSWIEQSSAGVSGDADRDRNRGDASSGDEEPAEPTGNERVSVTEHESESEQTCDQNDLAQGINYDVAAKWNATRSCNHDNADGHAEAQC